MTGSMLTRQRLRTAHTTGTDAGAVVVELVARMGETSAGAVVFFASPAVDGAAVAAGLAERFPGVPTIGCTTAGEFTEHHSGTGGVCAAVLPAGLVRRAAAALADLSGGVDTGVLGATGAIERQLGIRLRSADPDRYLGLVLIDGLNGSEERVNALLGNVAPLMSFVGGSAGDDLDFGTTRVFVGPQAAEHGAALLVLELTVPFAVVKTCSFEPSGQRFTVTEADHRVVWGLDGQPAAEAYARAVRYAVDELADKAFMRHPLGLMINSIPWIRSPYRLVDGRGVRFLCQMVPGMEVDLMNSTDLVGGTREAMQAAVAKLGGQPSGALMFNCILRRLELDARGLTDSFVDTMAGIPTIGFHTYGESWLGHMNQTLTGVIFGTRARR